MICPDAEVALEKPRVTLGSFQRLSVKIFVQGQEYRHSYPSRQGHLWPKKNFTLSLLTEYFQSQYLLYIL